MVSGEPCHGCHRAISVDHPTQARGLAGNRRSSTIMQAGFSFWVNQMAGCKQIQTHRIQSANVEQDRSDDYHRLCYIIIDEQLNTALHGVIYRDKDLPCCSAVGSRSTGDRRQTLFD